MYISGQTVKMVVEAAALVDDYLLTHRGSSGDPRTYAVAGERGKCPCWGCVCVCFSRRCDGGFDCHEKGNWKKHYVRTMERR